MAQKAIESFEFELPTFAHSERGLRDISFDYIFYLVGEAGLYEMHSETAEPNRAFRLSDYWHVDDLHNYSPEDVTLHLWSSSTPTEFAACRLDVDIKGLRERLDFWCKDTRKHKLDTLLTAVNDFLPEWLEIAGGIVPSVDKFEEIAPMIQVTDLTIVQAMPNTIASGAIDRTLHRSAKRHPQQPAKRVFQRGFTNNL